MATALKGFRSGSIYEILADFLLSSIGIANPSRRQFDQGFDFYCYLSESVPENDQLVKFDFPFNIQIKSGREKLVVYGKDKYEKWKKEDIDWLFRHQTPFFIGFVNTEKYELEIYDTTGLWFLYAFDKAHCSQIKFKPSPVSTHNLFTSEYSEDFDPTSVPMRKNPESIQMPDWNGKEDKGGGIKYLIDLGNPIVTLSVEDTKDEVVLEIIKATLRKLILLERKNIDNKNIGVRIFSEIKNNLPNDHRFSLGSTFQQYPSDYKDNLLVSLREALISLQINANHEDDIKLHNALIPLLKLIPKAGYYSQLYSKNPDFFSWMKDLL
jgi:hypothetical protein